MRTLILSLTLASVGLAQCPPGGCHSVRVDTVVTVRGPLIPMAAPRYAPPVVRPVVYATVVPVYTSPVVLSPVVVVQPVRTRWYPSKWVSGRRGQ